MMKISLLYFICLLIGLPVVQAQTVRLGRILTVASMKSEFRYVRHDLETTHTVMYVVYSPEKAQTLFDSLESSIQAPLTLRLFYQKIAFLIAQLQCEHSYCHVGTGWEQLVYTFNCFPLQPFLAGTKPFVVVNGTVDTSIHPGDEIISINGKSMDSICRELYRYIPADGFMTSSKAYGLSSMMFGIAYNFFIEQANQYNVLVKTPTGRLIQRNFRKDLSLKSINRLALKNPVNKKVLEADAKRKQLYAKELDLTFLEPQTAWLSVRSFSMDKKDFKTAIDSFFALIQSHKTERLVINLFNNGGGEEELASYLMSYLINKPTRFMEAEYLITDADSVLAKSHVPEEIKQNKYAYIKPLKDGKSFARISEYARELETMQPQQNGYHGQMYLLVNGLTSSAASTFAAVAQSNNRAVIIGQETAGAFSGGGATIGLDLTLPQSGINTHTSILYQQFATSGRDANRGVIPDREYKPSFKDLIADYDSWRIQLLSLMTAL